MLRVRLAANSSISDSSVVFLGFRHEELDFRILCQWIKTVARREAFPSLIQIDPGDGTGALDPERARDYLMNNLRGT